MSNTRSEEDRLWLEAVTVTLFGFFKNHFFTVVFWSMGVCVTYTVVTKLTRPIMYSYYKSWLQYDKLLAEIKASLEEGIPASRQNEPKILKAYLNLYAAFRELRVAAKRDHNDRIDPHDKRWQQFEHVRLAKRGEPSIVTKV